LDLTKFIMKHFALVLSFFALVLSCKPDEKPLIVEPPQLPTFIQYGTPMTNVPETKNIVMYEVNLRAFSSSGDLVGVTNRLDELEAMGVNVIWLMPIHPIGMVNSVNSPYSVKDFRAVADEYGTLADLRTLTTEAHNRGMAVLMDWVANHTAWDHEWVTSTPAWYTQDASGNIIHPAGTNWLDVADLNFDNAAMRKEMIECMKYWVYEANVDGYRCDNADGQPFDFWKQALDSLENIPNRDLIYLAEGGRSDHFAAGFQMNYGWNYYTKLKAVYDGASAIGLNSTGVNEYNSVPDGKHKLRFTTNHDESAWDATPMTLFNGATGATGASLITIYSGGVPLLYTGQEVGRTTTVPFFSNSPINWSGNPSMLQIYKDMLTFYSQSEVSKSGVATDYTGDNVVCVKKTIGTESVLVIANVRNSNESFILPTDLVGTSWTNVLEGFPLTLGSNISLAPYQYMLLKM
jgi:Alpha amylase, catalytic domain